jgi:hypothetical protein
MTDHKAEAEMLYDAEFGPFPNEIPFDTGDAARINNLLGAQVQATLYLAEQQRIANQIAYLQIRVVYDETTALFVDLSEAAKLMHEAGKGLGI